VYTSHSSTRGAGGVGVRRLRRAVVALLLAAPAILALTADAALEASSPAPNPIVLENEQPGTTAWQIGLPPYRVADDATGQIKGYATATSVDRGGTIGLNVSVKPVQQYTIDIYRLGCYPDASGACLGGRLMQHLGPLDGVTQPACSVDGPSGTNTGLTECRWAGPTFTVPATWTSGIYVALLTNAADFQNYIQFVVRDDSSHSAILYQQPVATYQAYNNWPDYGGGNASNGKSLYDNTSGGADTVAGTGRPRAVKVSFDRPYADTGSADLLDANGWSWEGYFIRWAEKNGSDLTYATSVDLDQHPELLLNHKAFLSVGHDEYWSKPMFDGAVAARDAGVNLGFFGANDVYWQTRFETSSAGVPGRVMVVYKNTPNNTYLTNDPVSDPSLRTVRWQDPPVNRPGQLLTGSTLIGSTGRSTLNTPYQVTNGGAWIYDGSGLSDGSSASALVGYEADKYSCMFPQPPNTSFTVVSSSPFFDAEDGYYDTANAVLYQAPSGAWVFSTGTMSWTWGLDRDGWVDSGIQQATKNILDGFTGAKAIPATPSSFPACAENDLMTFESGSLTSPLPPAPQDAAQRALGSVTLETANPITGSYSARLANVGNAYLDKHMTAVDDLNLTFDLRLNAIPAADARIALTYSQVATVGNVVLRSSGLLCMRNGNAWITGSATTSCTTSPLAIGKTYRIRLHELRGTGADGVFEAYLASGDEPFGAPFTRAATGNNAMRVDRVSVGSTTAVALDAVFDNIAIDGQPLQAPAAPSALNATSPSSSDVELSWADNASTESSYVVERSTSSSFAAVSTFSAPANATSYADRTVTGSTTYYYRVKATNALGDSGYSNVASVVTPAPPPAVPSGLAATVLSPSSTRLDWTDNSQTEASVVVERGGDPSFASVTTFVLPANAVTYTDSGLADGAYYYRVKAVNPDGAASAYSNIVRGPRIKNITFEDAAPNLISTATGVSSNPGGLVVQEAQDPIKGTYSAHVPNVANAYLEQSFAGVDDLFASFSVRLKTMPTSDYRIVQVLASRTTVANLWVRANGTLCLKWVNNWSGGSTASGCTPTSGPLTAGTVYRIAVHQRRGNGTGNALVEAFFAQGDNPFPQGANGNAVPFTSQSVPPSDPGYWTAQATSFRFGGTLSTTPLDAVFDDVDLDSTFLPSPPPAPPAAPSGLAATSPRASEVDLTWQDNAVNETSYVVQRSASSSFDAVTSFTLPANSTTYADTTVSQATTYYYRVESTNTAGESAPSNTATVTTGSTPPPPPAAPTNLVATPVSPTSTRLDWTDSSSTESGFVVERSGDGSFAAVTTFALAPNATTYTDSGLGSGPYFYRVRATGSDGTSSGSSNVVRGPRIKNLTFEDGTASLVNAVTGASTNPGGLVVQETAIPINGRYSARAPSVANAFLEQTFAGVDDLYASFYLRLNALPTGDYRIAQVIDSGTTVASLWIRVNGTLCLKWGNNWSGGSSSAGCTPTSAPLAAGTTYRIAVHQRRGDGTGNALVEAYFAQGDSPFPQAANGDAVPFTSQSVPPTDPAYWQTQATAFRFGATLSTTPLDAVFDDVYLDSAFLPTVPPAPPAAPSALAATSPGVSEVDLSWRDNATNETSYVVQRSTSSGFDTATAFTLPASSTTYADTSVAEATTYYYRVRAANSVGDSGYSNTATVTTGSTPPPPAAAPTSLVATPLSPAATQLAWTDNSSTEAGFVIERSGDASFSMVTSIPLPANTTTYTDSGLGDGPYLYRVKATNADGTSSGATNVVRGPRIKNVTFEDGTTSLVHAVTGASGNAGGLVAQEIAKPIKGSYSARVPNVANAYLEQTFGGVDDLYVSFYVRLNALPSADDRIAQVLASGTTVASAWVRTTGALCLKWGNNWSGGSAGAACTPSTKPLVVGTVYRVAVHQRRGDGTSNALVEAFFAQGDSPFPQDTNGKAVPLTSQAIAPTTAGYWQTPATAFRFGATLSTTTLDAAFDDVKLDSAFLPPPSTP
jgi:hypothetical protein